jgi:plasmid stabilization system protein ParE
VKVRWTDAARAQLKAIHNYVAQTSPEYARRIVDRLTERSIQIGAFPFSGRNFRVLKRAREFGPFNFYTKVSVRKGVREEDYSAERFATLVSTFRKSVLRFSISTVQE